MDDDIFVTRKELKQIVSDILITLGYRYGGVPKDTHVKLLNFTYNDKGYCHNDGNCCGPGSYCCQNNIPHEHTEILK